MQFSPILRHSASAALRTASQARSRFLTLARVGLARLAGPLPEGLMVAGMAAPLSLATTSARGNGLIEQLGPAGAAVVLGFLILSLAVHEAAHAWVANLRGDSTAKDLGRMTLNPFVHIDPFMSILLPVTMMLTTGMIFGGAKPVPVSYNRLHHPLRDMVLVAIAGPISNYLLAILFALVGTLSINSWGYDPEMLLPRVLASAAWINLILAIFNMIPLPPLDGSRVMAWLLPSDLRAGYQSLERYGLLIILALLWTGIFGVIIRTTFPPLADSVDAIVRAVVG